MEPPAIVSLLPDANAHPLAARLKLPAWEVLDALETGGFRALVALKGRLAEVQFEHLASRLAADGLIDRFEMLDKDGSHDADVVRGGLTDRVEVKNVHPGRQRSGAIVCETQKTRTSNEDPASRFYRIDQFDVVAACLFNVTGRWEFVFARTCDLRRHAKYDDRLNPTQLIADPLDPAGPWHSSLLEVLA